ncbi:type VI secretion system tip protein VgrG [Telluria mixta]|uniref:Type VI secretion system tip protein VgrG n=1 Tax=Telluria mixta TaxID=34071 RepID=A0ABT2C7K0_9BURK|nr:type VI secretion system Vgr family protein [Telluria mixta]MCS0632644.1 type VI secretion system tip protein VgrG [Telluria mixta]WEM99062.1 type VI secretion system tip protein TssI/VgrG [Telluria mixta]
MDGSQAIAAGAALSVFSRDAQHDRLMRMDFPRGDGPDAILLPNRLSAHEEVSRCFRFEVELLSDDARIPLKAMMARMVTISVVREDGSLRYFNGYITEFSFLRADGGFAFYRMVLEPWLAFAKLRKDNVSFHGKSVIELTELTFAHYRQADWHAAIVGDYPRMTCANQYDETDYNHLHRRWEDLGLHYWYEHREDGHTLWLSDKSALAQPIDPTGIDDSGEIPFRDKAGSLEDDGICEWSPVRRIGSGQTTLASFDYKNPVAQRSTAESLNHQGDVFPYEIYENTGSYGFRTHDDGERLAQQRMGERDANTQYFEARGNDRTAQPGRCFKLGGHFSAELQAPKWGEAPHPSIAGRHYLILSTDHEASNNYQAGPGAPSHYENAFRCVRKDIQWRPGRHYNSKPCTYPGIQTAIVVGPDGSEIHTDSYGRVKVQFHWDRLGNYDENSSPWLRVMSPGAGGEFGNIRLPRVGEEVAVVYLDGNIDHPVVLGALYNYTHMPPWKLPEQQALSGLRSRELQAGEGGQRGNHLVLDDTRGKIQAQLKSDYQCSQLSLGHITRIEDTNGRKDPRGEGWELRTDGHGVARAAKGLLITTEARPGARGPIKDMSETCQRLTAAAEDHQVLGHVAQKNGAQEADNNQAAVATVLQKQSDEIKGGASGSGSFSELAQPHVVIASPAGIATTTAQSTHIASDLDTAITAGKSVSIAAQDGFFASIRQTFRLFVQKAGMKLIAASGDIDVKALSDNFNLFAKLNITQTADRIVISAKEEILINGGGSYAKFGAGGIEHGTSGTFVAHAASHHLDPAKNMAAPDLKSNVVDVNIKRDLHLEYVDADGNPLQHDPIQAHAWDGNQHNSKLDATGKTVLSNVSRGSFRAEQVKRK